GAMRALWEVPGNLRVVSSPGRDEPQLLRPAWTVGPSDHEPEPRGGPKPGGPNSFGAPTTPGDEQPAGERAEAAGAAGFITRFLPFDPASLREDVDRFISALESPMPLVAEELLPDGWESVAAIVAGAGAALAVRRFGAAGGRRGLQKPLVGRT